MMKEIIMSSECSICNNTYDQFQHSPMILCKQQHLCCEECATRLSNEHRGKCPQCHQDLNKTEIAKFRQYLDWLNQLKECRAIIKKQQRKSANYYQITNAVRDIMEFQFPDEEKFYDFTKERAERLFEAGENYASIGLLSALIERFPNHQSYLFIGLGSKEEQIGFSEGKPLSWYKQRYGVKQLSAEDLLNHILMKTPFYKDGLKWFLSMIQKYPNIYKLVYGLALCYHNNDNIEDALKQYKIVIDLNPQFSKAYCMVAFLEENEQQALKFANICLAKDPHNVFAKFLIASKSKEKLIERLSLVYQQQSLFVRALNYVGDELYIQKQYEQAIKKYQACLQRNSLFFEPNISIGYSYLQSGNLSQALQHLSQLLLQKLSSNQRSQILHLMGSAYKKKKDLHQAQACFKRSIEADPQSKQAMLKLARLYEDSKKLQFAVKLYLKVHAKSSSNLVALSGITNCFSKLNNFTAAITYYKKMAEADPSNIQVKQALGIAYFLLEDWQNSLEYLLICKTESFEVNYIYPKIIDSYYKLGDYQNALKYAAQCLQQIQPTQEEKSKILLKIDKVNKALNAKQPSK